MATQPAATPSKTPAAAAGKFGQLVRPNFAEPPRYKLLEKSFLSGVKVLRGRDWMPFDDVLLNPEEQPIQNLSGPYGGRGEPERAPLLIEYEGIPDEHMEPVNEAGNWMLDNVDKLKEHARMDRAKSTGSAGRRNRNPVDSLSIVSPDAQVLRPVGDSV